LLRSVVWIVALAAILFGTAGTLRWPGAWLLLAETGGLGLTMGLYLARHDPALLAERQSVVFQRGQKLWDKVFVAAFIALSLGWLVFMALDAVRFRYSSVPVSVQGVGALLIALGMLVVHLTFRENTYAAPVVKIQAERGHRVISSGPYALVRHPMYAGMLLIFAGMPLLLGSWYGLAGTAIMAAMLAMRAVLEERMLADELPGYRDYAARVRYRLAPGVW
jgi:protein-S-isoprenylcysteine O-methyltransferase Ste14